MPDSANSFALGRGYRLAVSIMLLFVAGACTNGAGGETNQDLAVDAESQEKSGTELALNESYDHVRNGAHLILSYNSQTNSFVGTVCNTVENTLKQVRVEVHLSNGIELGPTTPANLDPGECIDVTLVATSIGFDGWSAHPEVGESGSGEHGNGEEEGENGEEGEGRHNEGGSD